MKYKSSKRKKRRDHESRRSWLADIGTLLLGIAAICEIAFKIVVYLLG